ncbi:hypothetical protein KVV02_008272 [Mortierella alpina]|uniref:Uncharacterized protein n=1 Tax=Mortierella alpina TaxID=64518 RepID=A0A9P8A4J8_MORAP|nr:hypothetical protein KVV02_008272 [Mortierella alpina]
MPSSRRLEALQQARAIPLVTVSLARAQVRQSRAAITSSYGQPVDQQRQSNDNENDEQPPPYEHSPRNSSHHSGTPLSSNYSNGAGQGDQLSERYPNSGIRTEAVLNLSRSLVSASKSVQQPPPASSWLVMVIYSWTQTHRAATKLYHILTHPSTLLKEIQGQNELSLQQQKKQRKSIQQQTEEQDRLDDDPDMVDSGATEMVPVSMLNTRSIAAMEESLPEDGTQDEMDDSSDDSVSPGKLKRKIDRYPNPFGPNVSDMDEQEDDEGWLGSGADCSEYGETKSNSVRLTTPKLSQNHNRRIPDFSIPSLGPAMDPGQFEGVEPHSHLSTLSAASIFNTPRSRATSIYSRTSDTAPGDAPVTEPIATQASSNVHDGPSRPASSNQDVSRIPTVPNDHSQLRSSDRCAPHSESMPDSPWAERSHIQEQFLKPSTSNVSSILTSSSSSASFTDASSVAFSISSRDSVPSFVSAPSVNEVIS